MSMTAGVTSTVDASSASPAISCPPYMRRSPKVAEVLPILYLRGLRPAISAPRLKRC